MGSATISVDEFQALEQKVLQTVELIKKERDARAAAEAQRSLAEAQCSVLESERTLFEHERNAALAEVAELREKLSASNNSQAEIESLQREREAVRLRVEKMVAQMDELL
jgi:hypothetical protein